MPCFQVRRSAFVNARTIAGWNGECPAPWTGINLAWGKCLLTVSLPSIGQIQSETPWTRVTGVLVNDPGANSSVSSGRKERCAQKCR